MVELHACAAPLRASALVRSLPERVIGELLGWDIARGVHPNDRTGTAILAQLLPRYLRGDPVTRSYPGLAPSAVVDRCLGRLVAIARSEFDPSSTRSPLQSLEVREQILARIHGDAELTARARVLRTIAGIAETVMEHHYSATLLASLRATPAPHTASGPERMKRLNAYLSGFPYADNYAHLVRAELALMQARPHSIAVLGCGPLPITGLMLHAWTGARVSLVDIDTRSADRAAALVAELTRLGVLDPGAVRVHTADAADPSAWSGSEHDVALVASLVPQSTKRRLSRTLRVANDRVALLLRSAAGLCAELAYEPVTTHEIESEGFALCRRSVPSHLLVETPANGEHSVIAHASVLNTTELFHARSMHGVECPCPTYDRNDCCS